MVVPHEVPLGPRGFINREPDFDWMTDFWAAFDAGVSRMAVITGLPGVGKTAFVRRCVERSRAAGMFTAGELHIDFGSIPGVQLSVTDALAFCLAALGVSPGVMPATLPERANRLRSLTACNPVLIVLENVTEAAQVLPFLPNSPASALLVTSHRVLSELDTDGAEFRYLAPFTGAAGEHLIAEIIGSRARAEPTAVAELVRQCAGLPVALTALASKLKARPALRVDAVVAEIVADERGFGPFVLTGRDTVTMAFSQAYAGLGEAAARLYRMFGLYPGQDLTLDTAVALAGTDTLSVSIAVDAMLSAGVLAEDSNGRLSLHPLLKRHAAQLARLIDPESERTDGLRRVARYLVVKAAFADLAVLGPDRYRCTHASVTAGEESSFTGADAGQPALDWLETERANLLAVQRVAFEHGWHDWTWQLAEALTALYVTRRYYTEWTVSSELGATAARLARNPRAEARLRSFASRAWMETGCADRAHEELVTLALPLAEASGDGRLLASVWELIGRYRDVADPARAIEAYRKSLELFDIHGDARGRAFVMFFLGCSQHRTGELAQAESTVRTAVTHIRRIGDRRMEGRALCELGLIADERGYDREGRLAVAAAIDILSASGYQVYEAQAQEQRLRFAQRDNDVQEQRESLNRLVDLHTRLGSARAAEFTALLDHLAD